MSPQRRRIGLDSRLASVLLVIVVAWALTAVVLLTGTLINLRGINQRVVSINHQYDPIDRNVSFVRLAGRTSHLTAAIEHAARPLPGELGQVAGAAGAIDGRVDSIYSEANAIMAVADQINTNVHSIDATAHGINGNVRAINVNVQAIGAKVAAIAADVGSIHGRVSTVLAAVGLPNATGSSVNADVSGIHGGLAATLSTVRAIRRGVVTTNRNAVVVLNLLRPLKSIFDGILGGVGTDDRTPTVLGHANSIDCARLINGRNCDRTAAPTGGT